MKSYIILFLFPYVTFLGGIHHLSPTFHTSFIISTSRVKRSVNALSLVCMHTILSHLDMVQDTEDFFSYLDSRGFINFELLITSVFQNWIFQRGLIFELKMTFFQAI